MSRLFPVFMLSLMVVLAHTYCIERHAREAAGMRVDGPAPLSPPAGPSCENESSCICKGAVLAVAVAAPEPTRSLEVILDSDTEPAGMERFEIVSEVAESVPRRSRWNGGATGARAWLQSFLI